MHHVIHVLYYIYTLRKFSSVVIIHAWLWSNVNSKFKSHYSLLKIMLPALADDTIHAYIIFTRKMQEWGPTTPPTT